MECIYSQTVYYLPQIMNKKVVYSMIFSKNMIWRAVIFAIIFTIFLALTMDETQNSINIGQAFILTVCTIILIVSAFFIGQYCSCPSYECYKMKRNTVPIKREIILNDGKKLTNFDRILISFINIFSIPKTFMTYFQCIFDIITDYNGRNARNLMAENPEYRSDLEHNEIVIAPSKGLKSAYFTYGPDDLFKYFQKNKIPYRVTICESADDFEHLIIDDTAAVLWLFGHGNIGGYLTENHEIVRYSKYQEEPYVSHRKKAIYQLHCNSKDPYNPNPLSRILVDGWDFLEKGNNNSADNKAFVRFAIENKEEFPGIWDSI